MLRVTGYVVRLGPIGVFAAVANVVAMQGLGVLLVYGKFIGSFYLTLGVLWVVLIGARSLVLKKDVFRLVKAVRQPVLLGFSTASSESAYPRLMEQLKGSGVNERVSGFVLPLGYSFNAVWIDRQMELPPAPARLAVA